MNDENGDGDPERLHLSVDPPRLHLLVGIAGNPPDDPVKQHVYELALEDSDPYGFRSFSDDESRVLMNIDGDFSLTLIPGTDPPLYAERVIDLDNDGITDEAFTLTRSTAGPGFVASVYAPMTGPTALVTQSIVLPPDVEPDSHRITDLNGDVMLDVAIFNRATGRVIFLSNDSAGQLVPGDHDLDNDVDQEDFARLQVCFTGQDAEPVMSGCGITDLDGHGDVEFFKACASDPEISANPICSQ